MTRPDWDHYLMGFAQQAATRGNCLRAQVGAVLVQEKQIISTGYGGAPPGMPTCLEVGCDMLEGHCVRTVHAEMNALIQAASNGRSTKYATLYSTVSPCWWCFRTLFGAGVIRFVSEVRYWHKEHVDRVNAVIAANPYVRFEVWKEHGQY